MKSIMQTKEWVEFRKSQGWQVHDVEGIYVLERNLPLGKSFLYAPEVTLNQLKSHPEALLKDLSQMRDAAFATDSSLIAQNDINNKAIFFRLEILDEYDENIIKNLEKAGFVKAFEEVQPEWRQVIDITRPEEEILAQMKEKGRYNIRIAERNGVIIKKSENILDFYRIFQETAERDGFSIRQREYFQKMLEFLGNYTELLIAEYQGKIVAAEIVSYYDETATYLYGASSNEYRNVMAPYLLHWQAIRRAKQRNCKYYDLLAVDPITDQRSPITEDGVTVNSERSTVNHKYSGIGRFKRQFGGRSVQIVGSWDYVYKPLLYKLFRFAEKIRRR